MWNSSLSAAEISPLTLSALCSLQPPKEPTTALPAPPFPCSHISPPPCGTVPGQMASSHPQSHLWLALQRRFADQRKPSTAPDRLLRALCAVPLDGQEESATLTLGFREAGSVLRTVSLSRDFAALATLVEPDTPCYLVVYVGDVQQQTLPSQPQQQAPSEGAWVLISYVPATCSSFEAKKIADNRATIKNGLGADAFVAGGMWCVSPDQITLSGYMRSVDSEAASQDSAAVPAAVDQKSDAHAPASRLPDAFAVRQVLPEVTAVPDATEAIWEERIHGVRSAYVDSCSRLVGALEELEQTLCTLTGNEYRADEPLLHARAHMSKNLELLVPPARP